MVRVLGADVHDSRAGIWMELLDGETLHERLQPEGRLSPREVSLIGLDLCVRSPPYMPAAWCTAT